MTAYTSNTDTIIDVYQSAETDVSIGLLSRYKKEVHPGSNKRIIGWQWDKTVWPSSLTLESLTFVPMIFDPLSAGIDDSYWQSGIGNRYDLRLEKIAENIFDPDILLASTTNPSLKWMPQIRHGYFYNNYKESYLHSDDFIVQPFYNNQLVSGIQYLNLKVKPKPGIPITVRRYAFDKNKFEYVTDIDFEKKVDFSGTLLVSGEQASTRNSNGDISYHNIDTTKYEFITDYEDSRVYLNNNYTDTIASSGDYNNYELLGISDGWQREYYLNYSPIDPSGLFHLVVSQNAGSYFTWGQVNSQSDYIQNSGQYTLDPVLGKVTFGQQSFEDWQTFSGENGLIPPKGSRIYASYLKSIAVEYEPEFSRDTIDALNVDLNPLKNSFEQGFLTISSGLEIPSSIELVSSLDVDSTPYTYETNIGGSSTYAIAKVLSNLGNPVANQEVVFEIEDGYGTFSNGLTKIISTTDKNGEARVLYQPPTTLDNISKATDDITFSGNDWLIARVFDIQEPLTMNDVSSYWVYRDDTVLGYPSNDSGYFTNEDSWSTIERSNPKNISLQGVFYENGLFVAVGSADGTDAYLITSTDGIIWTERNNPKNFGLYDIFYGNGLFAAVGTADGTDAYLVTSPDGVTWTERTNPKNKNLSGVFYGNGLFVAVGFADGTDAYIVTSPDGINWTEQSNPKNKNLQGIFYGNGLFAAVGTADGTDAYIVTSPDGINWTEQSNPKNKNLTTVFYANGLFVAVGNADGTDAYIVTSPDGINWTEQSNPKNFSLYDIAYTNGLFVAVGGADGTDAYIVTSPDGINWTEQSNPKNFSLYDVAYGNGLFVAVGNADGTDAYIFDIGLGSPLTDLDNTIIVPIWQINLISIRLVLRLLKLLQKN
jgi:hypothetical protein